MFEFDLPTDEILKRRLRYLLMTEYDGNISKFYRKMYPQDVELNGIARFEFYLKRGQYNHNFFRLLAEKTKVGEVPLRRLFDLDVNNEDLFK
ncbi:hypothetical protein KIH87_16935 [Paraneptunicella aestuarii]|uniref:hypothetical protein n=1 Tax=Paraneptunicella aestuarii TaxID=2831148 RepID=UPI001E2B0093|nr:hypothetical protein [Paraneptunicella aestuarii]UAA38350.1 hypothetical protein KIH87_16935 [Paraneptunicella aestuarii]